MTRNICAGLGLKCCSVNSINLCFSVSYLDQFYFFGLTKNVLDRPCVFFLPQVSLLRTLPTQPCPRKSKRVLRHPTTLNWEVTSTGRCWFLEGSGCTHTSRSRCSLGRTPTSRMDTEPTCPLGSASRGERQQILTVAAFPSPQRTLKHDNKN